MALDIEKFVSQDDGLIKKANSLIQLNRYIDNNKGQSLSLLASKVFVYAISQLDQDEAVFKPVEFSIRDFWEQCGIVPRTNKYYTLLADALKQVSDKSGWVQKINAETGRRELVLVRLLEKPKFSDDGKTCVVRFDPDMAPALLKLKGNFTEYRALDVMKLDSKYGFALYELLCSYEYLDKEQRFSFQDLAERIDATHYDRPVDFKRKVIEAAVNDINKHCADINVNFRIEKTGKKMSHVVFVVTRLNGKCHSVGDIENQTDSEWDKAVRDAKQQVEYNIIAADIQSGALHYDMQTLDLLMEIIADVMTSNQASYKINEKQVPKEKVRERFAELDLFHIQYVLEGVTETQTSMKNPRAYLRAALYNAPATIDVYYTAKVNADMAKRDVQPSGELGDAELKAIQRVMRES